MEMKQHFCVNDMCCDKFDRSVFLSRYTSIFLNVRKYHATLHPLLFQHYKLFLHS